VEESKRRDDSCSVVPHGFVSSGSGFGGQPLENETT
jgi:hypothetical protein